LMVIRIELKMIITIEEIVANWTLLLLLLDNIDQ
jgi:hypothetical protein